MAARHRGFLFIRFRLALAHGGQLGAGLDRQFQRDLEALVASLLREMIRAAGAAPAGVSVGAGAPGAALA